LAVDVQKAGLETLNKVLQTSGQNLSASWGLVFDVVRSVTDRRRTPHKIELKSGEGVVVDGEGAAPSIEALPTSAKAGALVRVAFPSLQLICTDFLSLLPPTVLHTCIEALGSFGSQADDLNISLTAVGLMWQISDFVLTKRQELEEGGIIRNQSFANGEDVQKEGHEEGLQASPSVASDGALSRARSSSLEALRGPTTTRTMDTLWMLLLGHLSQLCSDPRPEVRNSANQTLFRTIGMNGQRLILDAWKECIWNVLFPLLERIKMITERSELATKLGSVAAYGGSPETPVAGSPQKNKLLAAVGASAASPTVSTPVTAAAVVHHSRDTISKQWDETKVITLAGVTKCFLDFLPVLVELGEGFDRAWSLFLDYLKGWCLTGSPEVAMAGIKSLKTLVQYPKGENGVPEIVQKKVLDLWRVVWDVWEGIGVGLIQGADENAGLSTPGGGRVVVGSGGIGADMKILHGSFTQDCINAYAGIVPDLYDVIRSTFGLFELKKLLNVLSHLLLYHTNPQPGATLTKIRADQINDLETLSPFQSTVLDLITGDTIAVKDMKGGPELVISTVAHFVTLPFVRGSAPAVELEVKGFTYIAMAKRSMQCLAELYEKYGKLKSVYSSGAFERTVEGLGVPMRAKYDCPNVGNKDSTPLWKVAASICLTILGVGLGALGGFVEELPLEISTTIYSRLLDTLEGFLLPARDPPSTSSVEELSANEAFDISVLTTVETDILMHIGKSHVPEALIKRLVEIIRRGTKLYSTHLEPEPAVGSLTVGMGLGAKSKSWTDVGGGTDEEEESAEGAAVGGGERTNVTVKSPALGSDVKPVPREQYALNCFDTLFSICSDAKDGEKVGQVIATLVHG
ncbi:Endocytosis and vacuole integrity protein, partial [Rhizophlyctis rosea]